MTDNLESWRTSYTYSSSSSFTGFFYAIRPMTVWAPQTIRMTKTIWWVWYLPFVLHPHSIACLPAFNASPPNRCALIWTAPLSQFINKFLRPHSQIHLRHVYDAGGGCLPPRHTSPIFIAFHYIWNIILSGALEATTVAADASIEVNCNYYLCLCLRLHNFHCKTVFIWLHLWEEGRMHYVE